MTKKQIQEHKKGNQLRRAHLLLESRGKKKGGKQTDLVRWNNSTW